MFIRWFVILLVSCFSGYAAAQEISDRVKAQAFCRQPGFLCAELDSTEDASRCADVVLMDDSCSEEPKDMQVACLKQNLVTEADSSAYLAELLRLHSLDKNNRACFRMLMEYFASPGHEKEMDDFVENQLRQDSTDRIAWALKGEGLMRKGEWTKAIQAYTKATEQDSLFVEAVYNIGICYCVKSGKTRVVDDLTAGIGYLERVSLLDPRQTKVKWEIPLRKAKDILNEYRIKERKKDNE